MNAPVSLTLALLLVAGCAGSPDHAHAPAAADTASADVASPYVGEEMRPIKALSAEDVEAYRTAQGMGLAKAAELNHYPGPLHVLDLADELQLTDEQHAQTQAVYEAMRAEAVPLGERIVEREGDLDALFATGAADSASVHALLRDLGRLQADLRFAHLKAHLAMKALLTDFQVRHYDMVRGYAEGASHDHSDHQM